LIDQGYIDEKGSGKKSDILPSLYNIYLSFTSFLYITNSMSNAQQKIIEDFERIFEHIEKRYGAKVTQIYWAVAEFTAPWKETIIEYIKKNLYSSINQRI
jgi:hypothetical protein